jgi:hypothetical protein
MEERCRMADDQEADLSDARLREIKKEIEARREEGEWVTDALEDHELRFSTAWKDAMPGRHGDWLEVISRVATQATEIPDDHFALGRRYLLERLDKFSDEVEHMAFINTFDAQSDEIGTGLKGLEVMVTAANTEHFPEANRLHDEISRELARTTASAQEGLERARTLRERARREVDLIARRARWTQLVALTGVAAAAFAVGAAVDAVFNLSEPWGFVLSLVVATLLFFAVDNQLTPRVLEPFIRRRNRREFAAAIEPLIDAHRDAAVRVSAVHAVLERRSELESETDQESIDGDGTSEGPEATM